MSKVSDIYDIAQLNYKIIANSFYGVCGTPASRFYFPPVAMSITLFGQEMIKTCKESLKREGFDILYSDSVTKDSKIYIKINDKIEKIEISELFPENIELPGINLYNEYDLEIIGIDYKYKDLVLTIKKDCLLGEKEYIFFKPNTIYTLGFDTIKKENVFYPLKYVMRHKVNKKIYNIQLDNNKNIKVTEDHSIIVIDEFNNLYVESPKTLFEYNRLTKHNYKFIEYFENNIHTVNLIDFEEIEYNGYVYDIEIENIHNFYANDILVHNTDSTFINLNNLVPEEIRHDKEKAKEYIVKNIIPKLYEIINPEIEKLAKKWGIKDSRLAMKQEVIGDKIIFFFKRDRKEGEILSAKKRYIAHIIDEEGVPCDKLMIRGLEIRRSELSKEIKDKIKEIYEYIINTQSEDEKEIKINIIKMSKEFKKYVLNAIRNIDIDVIGININIKNLDEYKGNTPQYRGLLFYNIIAEVYNLPKTKSVVKGKMIYIKLLRNPKHNKIFSYIVKNEPTFVHPITKKVTKLSSRNISSLVIVPEFRDLLPKEIWYEIKIDEDKMLERLFYSPLTPIFDIFNIKKEEIIV